MKTQFPPVLLAALIMFTGVAPLQAQLVADGGTLAINGIATNLVGSLIVGNSGSFTTLIITNAGTVTNTTTGAIGSTSTARTNRVIVTGTNSIWNNGSTLNIGVAGQFNELIVTNGGLVLNNTGNIGLNTGSLSNRVVVTGGGSVWKCSQAVNIGNSSSYTQLIITNGGRVEALSGSVGNGFFVTGNLLLLTDAGSRWTSGNALHCGQSASGNLLVISNGADVVSSGAYVGGNLTQSGSGSSNSVVITGFGSTWTNTGTSSVGNSGAYNRLTITNGGVLNNSAANAALVLGWQPSGSSNTVLITGAGSLFANPGSSAGVSVGQGSPFNEFQIRNGGSADCDTSSLGGNVSASNNLAVVADSGSVWVNQIVLNVGQSGSDNQLLVTNNGMVRAGSLLIGSQPASSNNLVVINGGTLTVTNSGNSALLDIRRGRLTLAGGTMDCNTLLLTNVDSEIKLQGGLARLRNTTCTVASGITVGDNGPQTTLELVGNGTHTVSGGVVITNQGVLAGQGSIVGSVTNSSGGTLTPGSAPGALANVVVSGTVRLNTGSTNRFEISKTAATNDHFSVGGTIIYGGTLVVSNLAGTLISGDNFKLFTASSYTGAFSILTLPALNPGLGWTNKLLEDGSIEVVVVPPGDRYWTNTAGGSYNVPANWLDSLVPGSQDNANFTNNASYQVNWPASAVAANAYFNASSGNVTQAIGSSVWTLTNSLIVGANSGSYPTVVVASGSIKVTNTADSALLEPRRGSLRIEGGVLEADRILFNTPGSEFTLNSGTLITRGSLSFGSASSDFAIGVQGIGSAAMEIRFGSIFRMYPRLTVGSNSPYNRLVVTNGGNLLSGYLGLSTSIGRELSASNNSAYVTGIGSMWSNVFSSAIFVGENGSDNLLQIENGGRVVSAYGVAGDSSSANRNRILVTGSNSVWFSYGSGMAVSIGQGGAFNSMVIQNGGTVIGGPFSISQIGASVTARTNLVMVDGTNSSWLANYNFILGDRGSDNRLVVTNGAYLLTGGFRAGEEIAGSNNIVVIAGPGSRWDNTASFLLGEGGANSGLIITNGASLNSAFLYLGINSTSTNNYALIDGDVSVTNTTRVRRGKITLNSGSLNTAVLELNEGAASQFELKGGNLRSGSTTVTNGQIFVIGGGTAAASFQVYGGSHIFTDGLQIAGNGSLIGTGTIIAGVTNASGGMLSPGSSIGTITIPNNLMMLPGSTNFMEVNAASNSKDSIVGLSNVVYGGTLIVTNLAGTLTNGDRFVLFAAQSYSGAFDTLTLPVLVAGLAWTNKLSLDGSLEVIAVVEREVGVDVSHFQNESGVSQSSWNQMYAEGKRFAFIKATEGLTGPDDAAMFNNVTRATAAGVKAGVYHFAHPENRPTTTGAVQEADHFLAYAGNFIGPGYLRPVLDVEFNAAILGTTELTDWVIAFSDRIIALRGSNAAPIIYCNQTFANDELDSRLASYDLWLRTISGVDPATSEPPGQGYADPTGVFNNWSFWQYSDSGTAGGITPLDLNVCHSDFKLLSSFVIPATLTPVPPIILGQPQNQMSTVGGGANFAVSISITSSPPLFYQWRLYGTNLAGATQSGLTLSNVQGTNAGAYTVVVTNAAGAITSAVANLTIFQPYVLYQEDFDGYVSPSVVTTNTTTNGFKIFWNAASGPLDFTARFGFDYSALTVPTNIPPAPRSVGTTKGLSLTVNKDATAAAAAINLYPISQSLTGSFAFKFDLWINWTNTSAATEHALFGINHSGNITNRIQLPTSDGLFFAVNGDGGSTSTSGTARDYSVFRGGGTGVTPLLTTTGFGPAPLLGAQFDNLNPGFTALSPSRPVVNFSTPAGSAGLGWMRVEVRQETNLITWLLNDTIVAQYTNTTAFTNGNVMIGYNDVFNSIGEPGNFAIFDNLRVETIGPDYDMDGLLDAWEIQFFGGLASGAGDDSDGDGASNSHEYLAGTNPTNAASTFKMLGAARINDDITLSWTTVGGRGYRVQLATNATAMFGDISPLISVGGVGDGATNYLHFGGATNQGGFYRIRIEP